MRAATCVWVICIGMTGCDTVDLGDNFIAPDVQVDDEFFYCRIQPEVVSAYGCAAGTTCHSARSALRLLEAPEPPPCTDNRLTAPVPSTYQLNLEAIRPTVATTSIASPFYRRPTQIDSHPIRVFAQDDPAAQLIREWIDGSTP
jgi:hypothetical protein